ncbi:MAG: glycosyltransferase family 25 protein [Alphaproteobacteria bacterium]|nr:glycosyltransferase family 25 protein [Alphaproteobacteria bacterium]
MTPPIFVISLAREVERRTRMVQELAGFDFEFFDAVDGRTLDTAQYAHRMDAEWFRIMRGRELAPGEIGCFLSHYGVWERLVGTGTRSALILEDDARLEDGFAAVIGEAMKIAAEWDVVYLARMKRPLRTVRTVAVLDGCRRLIQCRRRTGGIGYLIRLEAAEALLHYCWRIRTPIDYLYTGWWDNGLRVYAVDPPVVRHAEMPSTIMTWKGGKWPKLKRTALEHAAGYLHRRADKLLSLARAKSS